MKPRIIIRKAVYDEIMYYVRKTDKEVSGMGKIIQRDDGAVEVVSCYFPKQTGTGASTDICDESLAKIMYESRNDEGELLWWWHSHPTFKVFMSSTDQSTGKQLSKRGCMYATCFNQDEDMHSAYFQGAVGWNPPVFVDDIDTEVECILPKELTDKWDKIFEENFSIPLAKPVVNLPLFPRWANHGRGWDDDDIKPARRRTDKGKFQTEVRNAQTTVLGADDDLEWATMLDSYIKSPVDYALWVEGTSNILDKPEAELSYREIFRVYESYDGDLHSMELAVAGMLGELDIPPMDYEIVGGK